MALGDKTLLKLNEAKEIARLKRELRDAQDALDVLKKAIGILVLFYCLQLSFCNKILIYSHLLSSFFTYYNLPQEL